jgi:predicted ATPase
LLDIGHSGQRSSNYLLLDGLKVFIGPNNSGKSIKLAKSITAMEEADLSILDPQSRVEKLVEGIRSANE